LVIQGSMSSIWIFRRIFHCCRNNVVRILFGTPLSCRLLWLVLTL
jgi:hypothetical protein